MDIQTRRNFLIKAAKMAGISACGIAAIASGACENFIEKSPASSGRIIEVDISEEAFLSEDMIGYGVMKKFKGVNYGIPVILVRLYDDEFVCFSSMCTHAHCSGDNMTLSFGDFEGYREIVCGCHGSQFDPFQNGKAVKGPAEKPLKSFNTSFDSEANILYIYF